MNPFYTGEPGRRRSDTPFVLPDPVHVSHEEPAGYRPDPGLVTAFNVALLLGQPLLVTGEPGTGKTLFARAAAYGLNLPEVLEVRVKSTTTGTDLLYHFDELSLFRDNQPNRTPQPLVRYLRFNGLGEAILRAAGPDAPLFSLQGHELKGDESLLHEAFGVDRNPGRPTCRELLPGLPKIDRSPVVLIDELDKAPRDTPNDLLREIENLAFDIPELGVRVSLSAEARQRRPIVLITSNSEKSLPEAFLRRCAYYHIPFPTGEVLRKIVDSRLGILASRRDLIDDALELFEQLREGFRKPPGTAELLGWLDLLSKDGDLGNAARLRGNLAVLLRYLPALAKVPEDLEFSRHAVRGWSDGK